MAFISISLKNFTSKIILKNGINLFLILCILFIGFFVFQKAALALDPFTEEGICTQDTEECDEIIPQPVNPLDLQKKDKKTTTEKQPPEDNLKLPMDQNKIKYSLPNKEKIVIYLFWGYGCPHCEAEKIFLNRMKQKNPRIEIKDFEVWYNKENAELFLKMAKAYNVKTSGVPVTFIGNKVFVGFSEQSKEEIIESIQKCLSEKCVDPSLIVSGKISGERLSSISGLTEKTEDIECKEKSKTVHIPWIGNLEASEMSLPAITVVIAGLDSFNPCAFFVLFSLLGLLIHANSRSKMLLIGSVFVFFSGFIYFLFMTAWLNLFLVMGQVGIITTIAGIIAIFLAFINIKDFFAFKKGISLTISDRAKPKLFDRMRKLMKSTSFISILIGAAILAAAANSYELLCTAGFPMVFTRILTLNNLSHFSYYMYLVLYNVVYIIPLSLIVLIFTITLGRRHLTEWQGRVLKLVSGTMMLGLGGILLLNPAILNNAFVAFLLLSGAITVSFLIAFVIKKLGHQQ